MAESSPQTHSPLVTPSPGQKVLDTVFDVSFIVLATLEDISKIPACPPPLACAAGAAMDIYRVAQVARQNHKDFKRLAKDSCELVYAIIEKIQSEAELPDDLTKNLQQLVDTLTLIQLFAQKKASKGFWKALLRSNTDAAKIVEYRGKLAQSLNVFGLQSNIKLHGTLAKIASQQLEMLEAHKNQAKPDANVSAPSMSSNASAAGPLPLETLSPAESVNGPVSVPQTVPRGSRDAIALSESFIMGDGTSSVGSDAVMEGGASIPTMIPAHYEGYATVLAGVCAIAMTLLGEDDIHVEC